MAATASETINQIVEYKLGAHADAHTRELLTEQLEKGYISMLFDMAIDQLSSSQLSSMLVRINEESNLTQMLELLKQNTPNMSEIITQASNKFLSLHGVVRTEGASYG